MGKLELMIVLTLFGVVGTLTVSPFYGIAVYYLYSVLRPQFLWEWVLPKDIPWSYYLATSSILATIVWRFGASIAPKRHPGFIPPRLNIGHATMAFFAFWVTVTYYTAFSQSAAEVWYDEYKKIFIMFFVSALAVTTVRQVWILYLITTLALSYIAFDINHIYIETGYMFVYRRGYCGLDNNGAALMLAMGVPLCLFAWDGTSKWYRWGYMLCIPLLIHAVLTSFSRGAMLSLVLSIPIYFIRCRNKLQFGIILIVLAGMVSVMAGKEIQDRFFTIEKSDEDESAQSRLTSWGIAWTMACEKPIFGFGVRNSNLFTFDYGADIPGRTIHSNYLQIAADSGFVGLIAYLSALGGMAYCLARARGTVAGYRGFTSYVLGIFGFFLLKHWRPPIAQGLEEDDAAVMTRTIANGVEGSMLVFIVGSVFLSLETFELPYIVMFLGVQLWSIRRLTVETAIPVPHTDPTSQVRWGIT